MAITDSLSKSIGLLLAIGLVGAIFIVGTILLRSRASNEVELPTKPYQEQDSGVIFDAPTGWSVGMTTSNQLQVRGLRISQIQSQKGSCSNFSKSASQSIENALEGKTDQAVVLWKKQFPGLVVAKMTTTASGDVALVGIDTCSPSVNRKTIAFRGQTYRNDLEVRFFYEVETDNDLSQAELNALAVALDAGTATEFQSEFNQFAPILGSIR